MWIDFDSAGLCLDRFEGHRRRKSERFHMTRSYQPSPLTATLIVFYLSHTFLLCHLQIKTFVSLFSLRHTFPLFFPLYFPHFPSHFFFSPFPLPSPLSSLALSFFLFCTSVSRFVGVEFAQQYIETSLDGTRKAEDVSIVQVGYFNSALSLHQYPLF